MKRGCDRRRVHTCLFFAIAVISVSATAREPISPTEDHPTTVYWGDTHLHTSLSSGDAYFWGNRMGLEEAYRFAKGEAVISGDGRTARLRRPLDFLVVADHAENLGALARLEAIAPVLQDTAPSRLRFLRRLKKEAEKFTPDSVRGGKPVANFDIIAEFFKKDLLDDRSIKSSIWEQVTATAERYNEPGRFTAFIGYEWSSSPVADDGSPGNLHRVVVFKDGASRVNQVVPFSSYDSQNPEDLWDYLARYEQMTGGEVLAIPHNGNTSNGAMFPLQAFTGKPLSAAYSAMRQRWEPLYEVTQTKGTSEAHPFLSPTDEFADFEIWSSWFGKSLPAGREWNVDEAVRKRGEYARAALQRGLGLRAQLGVNPFKLGLIGGTDAHNSLSGVDEDDFRGKFPINAPGAARLSDDVVMWTTSSADRAFWRAYGSDLRFPPARELGSAGYAAVWATENTREALFAAMKRRESYATTGTRIRVRLFGGWDYAPDDALRSDLALIGYRKGVPMGGDVTDAPAGQAPRLLIRAIKDPDGANLDRVQVIKGWRSEEGGLRERIYNVALSDGRKEDENGKVPPVGSTVDVADATYTNAIGDPELAVVWTDPDFSPKESAFYYVRVLEIPTPRWTTYDAAFFKVDLPHDVPATLQERAYTSPIWYVP